ncbi:MAG: hypothetical protein KGD63_10385 [Candidatus Lokiarchaeota archaeon]|nr:hypothetical protein [Candidatus Lokiarchaeota archaeon]
MHFLKQIIKNPILKNPAKDNMDIHRHFYRFSKGIFIGPAIEIRKTASKISFKGSLEYEDIIQEFVAKAFPIDEIPVLGLLITGKNIKDSLQELGLDWKLKASTGKTKNYKAEITGDINKQTLHNAIETIRESGYLLISFSTIDKSCSVVTKKRLPQPSKKKPDEDDVVKRIGFCKGNIKNTKENLERVFDGLLYDFKSDLPENWKKIIILNTYRIETLELPKDVKNSMMLRIMGIRKGKLIRTVNIDNESYEKQYSIVV